MIGGERLARTTNNAYTVADGSSKPSGVAQTSTAGVTAASATAITADELLDLYHSVDPAYRQGSQVAFMFNDTTFKEIRQLKDGNNQYLWQPGLSAGESGTLFGKPFIINQDVADTASSQKSVFFGDFSKYIIRDVRGIELVRLNERYAETRSTGFMMWLRTDGVLLVADAVKHIVQAA